ERAALPCQHLVDPPLRARLRIILALMRAAAFGARGGRADDALGGEQRVAQLEPFLPARVEAAGPSRWRGAELSAERRDAGKRGLERGGSAERAGAFAHQL